MNPVSVSTLPQDQWQNILSYLLLPDYLELSLTCKQIHAQTSTCHHLSTHTLRDAMTLTRLTIMLERFRSLRSLHLNNLQDLEMNTLLPLITDSKSAPSLLSLELHDCSFPSPKTRGVHINDHLPKLHSHQHVNKLQRLSITGNNFLTGSDILRSFIENSKGVRSLTLGGFRRLTDDYAKRILRELSDTPLEEFCLPQCGSVRQFPTVVTDRTARWNVRTLNIRECRNIRDFSGIGLSFPRLRVLDASFGRMTVRDVYDVFRNCPELEEVCLRMCQGLRGTLSLESRNLKVLDVTYCSVLERLEVLAPDLRVLEVGTCTSLHHLILDAPKLLQLNLSLLPIRELRILSTSSLQVLDLSGCTALEDNSVDCCRPPLHLKCVDIYGTKLSQSMIDRICGKSSFEKF